MLDDDPSRWLRVKEIVGELLELEAMYDPDNVSSTWADWEIHTVDGIELSTPFVWSATMEDENNAWTLDFRTKERRLRPIERSTNLRTICVRETK